MPDLASITAAIAGASETPSSDTPTATGADTPAADAKPEDSKAVVATPAVPKKFAPFSCYKKAYYRGKGNGLYYCSPDEDPMLALCYPKCKDGWRGGGAFCA
jgi:hypothetical protein